MRFTRPISPTRRQIAYAYKRALANESLDEKRSLGPLLTQFLHRLHMYVSSRSTASYSRERESDRWKVETRHINCATAPEERSNGERKKSFRQAFDRAALTLFSTVVVRRRSFRDAICQSERAHDTSSLNQAKPNSRASQQPSSSSSWREKWN